MSLHTSVSIADRMIPSVPLNDDHSLWTGPVRKMSRVCFKGALVTSINIYFIEPAVAFELERKRSRQLDGGRFSA
jgi:hypothetical protein